MAQRLDLTGERLDKKLNAGERLVFTLSEIDGYPSLDGLTATASVFVWLQGQIVEYGADNEITAVIDEAEDTLTVTLPRGLTAILPPLCEYRVRLINAGEPEKVMGGSLYVVRDGGLL